MNDSAWSTLNRLREQFLFPSAGARSYWRSTEDIALYDVTFGERVGWKWDAVLNELTLRGWKPQSEGALDWGCGSGIASRRVLNYWPQFKSLQLHDKSTLAIQFAASKAKEDFSGIEINSANPDGEISNRLLLLSHVINELDPPALKRLLELAAKAREIIWVEPGSQEVSKQLVNAREQLMKDFQVVAPCSHQNRCGLLTLANQRHWCHHFARPPSAIFQDSNWVLFGKKMNIDLRSLPYSFLVLEKKSAGGACGGKPKEINRFSRIIGEPRHYKGFSKILNCDANGVRELLLQKRDDPKILKQIKKENVFPLYRWNRSGDKILSGELYEGEELR